MLRAGDLLAPCSVGALCDRERSVHSRQM